jgi:hypothetical protein
MKQLKTKIGIAGLLLMLVFACKSNTTEKYSNTEKYSFEYNLEKGTTYKQILSTESKSTQTAMGQEMNSVINMTVAISIDVKDLKADSYIIDEKIDALRMDMEMMGTKVSFDSNTDEEKSRGNDISPVFKAMTNIPIEVEMNKQGQINYISGFDEISESVNASLSEADEETKQILLQQLEQQFSDEMIKNIIVQAVPFYPKNPVAVGDKWDINESLQSMELNFKTNMTMVLESVSDNVATIKGTGTVETPEGGIVSENNGVQSKVVLKGSQDATLTINLNTGWIINGEIVQNLKGHNEVMGMKLPMTTINTTRITNR